MFSILGNSKDEEERIIEENNKSIKEKTKEKTKRTLFNDSLIIESKIVYYNFLKIIELNSLQKNETRYSDENFFDINLDKLLNIKGQVSLYFNHNSNGYILEYGNEKFIIKMILRGYKFDTLDDNDKYIAIKINESKVIILEEFEKNAKNLIEEEKNKRTFMNILKEGVKFD